MISYATLEQKAKQNASKILSEHPHPDLTYHNMEHIQHVVDACGQMCAYYKYDDRQTNLLKIAAWFHDIGYYMGSFEGHEKLGAEQAATFLKNNEVNEDDIVIVRNCILATHMPQQPKNLDEEIICDADLSHLGLPDFYERSKNLRKELEKTEGKKIDKNVWIANTIVFLKGQHYFTSYGKEHFEPIKENNIKNLEDKLKEEDSNIKKNKKETKEEKPSKGIETMFRITSNNNQRLSSMADNKAHILISVNSIILSAIISLLLRKLGEYEYLSIPTYIILSVSVLSMIFSLLATRPNLPSGEFSQADLDNKNVNLLFFGNFYRMSLDDYTNGMFAVMKDYDYLYKSLIKDVYSQGIVLSHKYKLLRISYNIFMFGMIASVISFIIASILHNPSAT